jgi:hypothetical protein
VPTIFKLESYSFVNNLESFVNNLESKVCPRVVPTILKAAAQEIHYLLISLPAPPSIFFLVLKALVLNAGVFAPLSPLICVVPSHLRRAHARVQAQLGDICASSSAKKALLVEAEVRTREDV